MALHLAGAALALIGGKPRTVVGSRKSQLAMIQTNMVLAELRSLFPDRVFEVQTMETLGDRVLDVALSKIGAKSLFTGELEELLAAGAIDLIVHSLKDLPTTLPEGLRLGAIGKREDPRDSVIFRKDKMATHASLADLPAGAWIGTSSLRRVAQLKAKYPGLNFESVRGNLNTRLKKLDTSTDDGPELKRYSALVLAAAGVIRMGWKDRIGEYLENDTCLHAVGQGSIGLECREGDDVTAGLLDKLNHQGSALRCHAERAFMRSLEGGCSVPLGTWTEVDLQAGGKLKIMGAVYSVDGQTSARGSVEVVLKQHSKAEAEAAGVQLADLLKSRGAMAILEAIPRENINAAPAMPK